ncbi:nuclease A inhibitor family protein [Pontibacter vulgaris]|uniref:nuclease A inhibitor family protein n=1 Tax=Pontibacter vulgaris TaxID=2905679 RepID=UPI001FA785C7|nr:nuclease A inhibitor family protein [Pontibacter vulgaris]
MDNESMKSELVRAADGLLMLSETDAPLEYYFHEKPEDGFFDETVVVQWAGKPAGKKVEVQEVDYFFRNMMNTYPDDVDKRKQDAERFRQLVVTLKNLLQDVKVYRIHEIGIDVFILGRTPDGNYAGYKTLVVET